MELVYQIYRQMKRPENTQKRTRSPRPFEILFVFQQITDLRQELLFLCGFRFLLRLRLGGLFQLRLCHIHGLDDQKYDERNEQEIDDRGQKRPQTQHNGLGHDRFTVHDGGLERDIERDYWWESGYAQLKYLLENDPSERIFLKGEPTTAVQFLYPLDAQRLVFGTEGDYVLEFYNHVASSRDVAHEGYIPWHTISVDGHPLSTLYIRDGRLAKGPE